MYRRGVVGERSNPEIMTRSDGKRDIMYSFDDKKGRICRIYHPRMEESQVERIGFNFSNSVK